jgi:hypothetical protein
MAKSITAIKDILKREEAILEKIKKALAIMAHKESKASLREIAKAKRAAISTYKKILKASEKCPAVKKPAAKKKKAACKTKRAACKKKTVKKVVKKTRKVVKKKK